MIAFNQSSKPDDPTWHSRFMAMLPGIRRAANFRYRRLSPARKREVVDDVVGTCCAFYAGLVEKGQEERAYPSALVRFAAAQLLEGRQLGCSVNVRDISSTYCQQKKCLQLERLDQFDGETQAWEGILIEDRRAGPDAIAASRIDFAAWCASLSSLRREIANCLATGASTQEAARQFDVSPGRISQIRREFQESWDAFHGDSVTGGAEAA
jgi:hypothetical protein